MINLTQLKKRFITRWGLIISGAVFMLIIAGIIILTMHQTKTNTPRTATMAEASSESTAASHSSKNNTPTSSASGNTTNADKQASIAAAARPATNACGLLTASTATQLLGSKATSSTPQGTSSLQATDTSLSACAYTSGNSTVQLTIRVPNSSIGKSENAVVFGSGRPSDATSVPGYGQAAYWDPTNHTLNILSDNNWYVISRGSGGGQADAENVAALLKSGF